MGQTQAQGQRQRKGTRMGTAVQGRGGEGRGGEGEGGERTGRVTWPE